eukprot:COSAG02_NODE_12_length_58022_cov_242.077379_32_plen_159_part_00
MCFVPPRGSIPLVHQSNFRTAPQFALRSSCSTPSGSAFPSGNSLCRNTRNTQGSEAREVVPFCTPHTSVEQSVRARPCTGTRPPNEYLSEMGLSFCQSMVVCLSVLDLVLGGFFLFAGLWINLDWKITEWWVWLPFVTIGGLLIFTTFLRYVCAPLCV